MCNKIKNITCFNKHNGTKDKLDNRCKECLKIIKKNQKKIHLNLKQLILKKQMIYVEIGKEVNIQVQSFLEMINIIMHVSMVNKKHLLFQNMVKIMQKKKLENGLKNIVMKQDIQKINIKQFLIKKEIQYI